jgi:hypothetical protein
VIFLESNLCESRHNVYKLLALERVSVVPQDLPVPGCHLVAGSPIILGGFVAVLGMPPLSEVSVTRKLTYPLPGFELSKWGFDLPAQGASPAGPTVIVTLTSVKARRYCSWPLASRSTAADISSDLSRNHGARYHLTSVLYRDGKSFNCGDPGALPDTRSHCRALVLYPDMW